jgi:uncharacterized cysteine cluster protein YcgN (CxxCxxCC family)
VIGRRVTEALVSRRERWEALCLRCGLCCYKKEIRRGAVVTNFRAPCRYLDESTRMCTVYRMRFRTCAECRKMTIFHALFVSYLPETCGYVRRFRPWRRLARQVEGGI